MTKSRTLEFPPVEQQTLVERLRNRAIIRRNIQTRKSVQENKADRIADLLEEAANKIEELQSKLEKGN